MKQIGGEGDETDDANWTEHVTRDDHKTRYHEGERAQAQNNGGCGLRGAPFRCHPPGSPYSIQKKGKHSVDIDHTFSFVSNTLQLRDL
jgi:hypothetical protein